MQEAFTMKQKKPLVSHWAKLTAKQSLQLCKLRKADPNKWTQQRLAKKFKISQTAVSMILRGLTYNKVTHRKPA